MRNKTNKGKFNYSNMDRTNKNYIYKNFFKSKCYNTNFSNSNFNFVNFRGASLKFCTFYSSKFVGAEFIGTNLRGSNFSNSYFENTKFSNCTFENTNFKNCNFKNVFFSSIKNTKNLDIDNPEIMIAKTIPKIEISSELKKVITELKENDYIRRSKVFHLKKNRINKINIILLLNEFDEKDLIERLTLIKNNIDKDFYTLSYIEKILKNIEINN